MQKKVKTKDQEAQVREEHDIQEELVLLKGKKEVLDNLVIRPNIVGKKTLGALEGHVNGVRYTSQKGHKVDITYNNVKHAFF